MNTESGKFLNYINYRMFEIFYYDLLISLICKANRMLRDNLLIYRISMNLAKNEIDQKRKEWEDDMGRIREIKKMHEENRKQRVKKKSKEET